MISSFVDRAYWILAVFYASLFLGVALKFFLLRRIRKFPEIHRRLRNPAMVERNREDARILYRYFRSRIIGDELGWGYRLIGVLVNLCLVLATLSFALIVIHGMGV
jgi:hypothetical protein